MNGYVNGRWASGMLVPGTEFPQATRWNFVLGVAMFVLGFYGNIYHDRILLSLRKRPSKEARWLSGGRQYFTPHGGLFRWVSCPHYFCEMVEWIGYAVATWCLPSLLFALSTICVLSTRALTIHRWYLDKFEDYPRSRRAIIPYIL
ncbi:hypothetical protein EV182_003941 [Spiromyces aspiralis]|uniref:Uncharacterized protein n=1 Tax=Spiromyces aspiralis TaxID=68401 RepID=A0ACC1HT35_9FUNG|nr:hypothetical protein EV182_003941 [Spiromyces aspiralis]